MTINCKGKLLDLQSPKVMGILNITPNSFYDGGRYQDEAGILAQAGKMLESGASLIDVGAYSSKPGAAFVSEEMEIERIVPVIRSILRHFPDAILSVDTFRSAVAKAAVDNGAAMINDISAGSLDSHMMEVVAGLKVPYIMMHMKGDPNTMQSLNQYGNIISDMLFYFSEKIREARNLGISDIIIDPGFGFAKNTRQNYEVLQKMELFRITGLPILAGISRKSMIYKTLDTTPENALNGTTALNMAALMKGANILRVHDVKEAVECVKLFKAMNIINN